MSPETPPRGGSGEMFDAIAERYDLLNRILSLGIDQSWRRATVDALGLDGRCKVLDLATGTGDLALMIAERLPRAQVVGLDPSEGMLEVGRRKTAASPAAARIELVHGDAQRLPFEPGSFDAVSMAFGIRNVPDRAAALGEMARVVRSGGRIAILELSEPHGALGALSRFHVRTVVPWVGSLLSGAREYRYLQQSIAAFPAPERFAQLMTAAGLDVLEARRLSFGAAHLYVAEVRAR